MRHGLQQGIAWALAALMLYLVISAVRIGAADLFSGQATSALADASPMAMTEATRAYEWARRLTPDDPARHEALARLSLLQATQAGAGPTARRGGLRAALEHARRATAMRPASAYGWAILYKIKGELGEYDAEFLRALAGVTTFGPWESGLQVLVVDTGLAAWPALSATGQEQVMESFRRGMHWQPDTMLDIVRRHAPSCAGNAGDCAQ